MTAFYVLLLHFNMGTWRAWSAVKFLIALSMVLIDFNKGEVSAVKVLTAFSVLLLDFNKSADYQ